MEKKKVLLLASRQLANDGLTKIEMDVIFQRWENIDFEVACCFGFNNKYGQRLKDFGISCHVIPNKRKIFKYMIGIKKLVKKNRYDVVYIHGNSAMMFLEAMPSKIAGSKVVTHCHNTKSDFPMVHYIIKPFFNMFVDKKIGCSFLASKWAYCGKNIFTIPNGVEVKRFKFDNLKREQIRTELEWNKCKIIGHIGRFNKQKNHKKLIEIFCEMLRRDNTCRLLLIGDGELRDDIIDDIKKNHIENYIKIIDYTDKPQDYLQAMDLMVMPSLFEGLCLVAVEAQANGLPVLVDTYFSPETLVTDQAKSIELSLSNKKWADSGFELINKGRKNVVSQIFKKKMDQESMMNSIYRILFDLN